MTGTQITPSSGRGLPVLPVHDAQRIGAQMLSALDRMGFTHQDKDGRVFTICFERAALWGDRWVSFTVDVGRLWHLDVLSLSSQKVKATLAAATKREVKILLDPALTFVVRLKQVEPAQRLPKSVTLDLDNRPNGELMTPIGEGRTGPVWRSLPDLGHALIVGTSGAGKSTWLHSALTALLTANTPDQLQVTLIDPKQIELAIWAGVPHLRGPVACDVETATKALRDLVAEMDRRGDWLAGIGARDLAGYNRRAVEPLPYILAVIDECLDLTLQAGDKSELVNLLKRLASKARATGVILWLSATHGTADILPRVVSVNLSSRLVFRVQDGNAAQVAGCPGAQNIDRNTPGRLLAKLGSEPQELQGYYVADDSLQAIVRGLAGSKATGPALGDLECELVRYAVQDLDGAFTVNKLARAFAGRGTTNRKVTELAQLWERRGWLTKPQHATDARKVTPELCKLAGLTG